MSPATFAPDPTRWIAVPASPAADWSEVAAAGVPGADPAWLAPALSRTTGEVDEAESRWALVDAEHQEVVVVEVDVLDLGGDAADLIDVRDEGNVSTEEFSCGRVHGTRTVWVAPTVEGTTEDQLQAQALYVGTVDGTGQLVTLRTEVVPLDVVVRALPRCEEFLATLTG